MAEKPTITESIVEPKVDGPEAKAPGKDIESLVKELEKAGVTTAQELQGKLTASKEAGQLANLLGDANKRIENLEQAAKLPPAEPEYIYPEGESVDIEGLMNNVLDKREAKTRKIQNQVYAVYQRVLNDPDYGLVKEVWEAKTKNPSFNMAIQSGEKDVTTEYMETVREYYKGIAKQSLDTITTLQKGGAPASPHVEGEAQLLGDPKPTNTEQETVTKAKEKVAKGGRLTEDEEMAALDAILKGS